AFTKADLEKPIGDLETLEDWLRFWGIAKSQSVQKSARTSSKDFFARVRAFSAEKINPADFRLRREDPGYQARKDGRDLGADIDLVGPGPAFECWKQTPDYQQWLKDTGQVQRPADAESFVILARGGRTERPFATLAEAV